MPWERVLLVDEPRHCPSSNCYRLAVRQMHRMRALLGRCRSLLLGCSSG